MSEATGKIKCPKCGMPLDADAAFCWNCGAELSAEAPVAAPSAADRPEPPAAAETPVRKVSEIPAESGKVRSDVSAPVASATASSVAGAHRAASVQAAPSAPSENKKPLFSSCVSEVKATFARADAIFAAQAAKFAALGAKIASGTHREPAPAKTDANVVEVHNQTPASASSQPAIYARSSSSKGEEHRYAADRLERVDVAQDFNYGNPFNSSRGNQGLSSSGTSGADVPVELFGKIPSALVENNSFSLIFRARSRFIEYPFASATLSLVEGESIMASTKFSAGISNQWNEVSVSVTPSRSGVVSARLRLECWREDAKEPEVYESKHFSVTVYPNDKAKATALTLNIHNSVHDVNVDRAGDFAVPDMSPAINEALSKANAGESTASVIERCVNSQQSRSFPLTVVKQPSAVTLVRKDGFRLHILSDRKISFGRSRECNVVLRVFNNGHVDREQSKRISRMHFHLVYDGFRCRVFDESSSGTAVNDHVIPSKCSSGALSADKESTIKLTPNSSHGVAFAFKVCPRKAPSSATASLLLKREDNFPEAYLALWKYSEISDVIPSLKGYRFIWDGGKFSCKTTSGEDRSLYPGMILGSGEDAVSVVPFRQDF